MKGIMARALRPSALISGAFLVMTASIVANAVFLQSGRHPAPLFGARQAPAATERDARVEAIRRRCGRADIMPGRWTASPASRQEPLLRNTSGS